MKKQIFSIFIFIITLYSSCSHYDSNKVNGALLQGKWILKETDKDINDSILADYTNDSIIFSFRGDTCTEYIASLKHKENYRTIISNYELTLYSNNKIVNQLEIVYLSNDSLVLGRNKNWWKYKRLQ